MSDTIDEESALLIDQMVRKDLEDQERHRATTIDHSNEWIQVTNRKRNRKFSNVSPQSAIDSGESLSNGVAVQSDEPRRGSTEDPIAVVSENGGDSDEDRTSVVVENGGAEVKKAKQKKPKKVKVSVAEAASSIDAGDLGAFLADISESYESQQDVQLKRFADRFGRAFASVSGAQFPWIKTFKESNVAKLVDIPLSHISNDVYKISTDWIGKMSSVALGSFVEWSLDAILAELEIHQGASKGSKKTAPIQATSNSQVNMFVVLAMVLRRKPDVLINVLPVMKKNSKFQGLEKIPLIVWLITQASVGDLTVGLYMWSHFLLPLLGSKSTCNPQSRDLILQLVERILSASKARTILLNGAAKKGERLVPPSSLDILIRVTFPAASDRVKATERFGAIYPVLKEVALAGTPGSKAMKQLAQQMFNVAIKAVKEDIAEMSKESRELFFWCLKQNPECFQQWDSIYLENLEASVAALRILSGDRKELHDDDLKPLNETLKSFRLKNGAELAKKVSSDREALLKESEKNINRILGKPSHGHVCLKSMAVIFVAVAVGTAAFMSQTVHS